MNLDATKFLPDSHTGESVFENSKRTDEYGASRFACYLIAQNGDPRKIEIALAQEYFAVHLRAG